MSINDRLELIKVAELSFRHTKWDEPGEPVAGEWTTRRPISEGWYWAVLEHPNQVIFDCDPVVLVRVEEKPDDKDYWTNHEYVCFWLVNNKTHCLAFSMWTHWMGPLSQPELPAAYVEYMDRLAR